MGKSLWGSAGVGKDGARRDVCMSVASRRRSLGLHYDPDSLLWDQDLREFVPPADCMTWDAMHCILSNGIVDTELSLCMPLFVAGGFAWESMRLVVEADWRFPAARDRPGRLRDLFTEKRRNRLYKSGSFSLDASVAAAFMPVFGYALATVGIPIFRARGAGLEAQERSFFALQALVGVAKTAKFGISAAEDLRHAIRRHLRLFKAAYPRKELKPKNHWLWHVMLQLIRDGFCMDCIVGERFNHLVKEAVTDVPTTVAFDRTGLARLLTSHMECAGLDAMGSLLRNPRRCDELCGEEMCGRFVAEVQCSTQGWWQGLEIRAEDMLFLDDELHQARPGRPSLDGPARPSLLARGRGGAWLEVVALLLLDGAFAVMSYACSLVEQVRPPFFEPEFQHSWNLGGLKTSFLGGEGGGRKETLMTPPRWGDSLCRCTRLRFACA